MALTTFFLRSLEASWLIFVSLAAQAIKSGGRVLRGDCRERSWSPAGALRRLRDSGVAPLGGDAA